MYCIACSSNVIQGMMYPVGGGEYGYLCADCAKSVVTENEVWIDEPPPPYRKDGPGVFSTTNKGKAFEQVGSL